MDNSTNSITREFDLVVSIAIGTLGLTAFWDGITLGYQAWAELARLISPYL
jgi:hypothetical protein